MSDRRGDVSHELRSFGRRRGRRLSARQERLWREVLPRVSPDLADPPPQSPAELASLFPAGSPVTDVWLEIGFGGGEHLVWQAAAHPHAGIIGCEPFRDGVVKVLDAIAERGLGNVLVHPDDARPLLRWLPPASIGRAFILFPDPWPKARHQKRRLVTAPVLNELARVMRCDAELRIATDIGEHARAILLTVRAHPAFSWDAAGPQDWRRRKADWPSTRYEEKALHAGRRGYFFAFRRKANDE